MTWLGEARRAKTAARRGRQNAVPSLDVPGGVFQAKKGKSDAYSRPHQSEFM